MSHAPTSSARRERLLVGLVATAVGLLAVLVIGLGVGTWMALRAVSRMEAALGSSAGSSLEQLQGTLARTRELADELTQRQEAAALGLARVAGETAQRIRTLERRLEALQPIRGGPLAKLNQMIELQQLLAREQLALLQHTVETQEVLARSSLPLPTQEDLTQPPAQGGAGSAGTGAGGDDRKQ